MKYDLKGRQRDTRQQQSFRRETIDFNSSNILRLAERKDYFGGQDEDPVKSYYDTKASNRRFMRMKSEEKIDMHQFGKSNYLVAKQTGVGVAKFKVYNTRAQNPNSSFMSDSGLVQ